jgi:CYTH domain-containing protein
MSNLEIERKYLLPDDFDFDGLQAYRHTTIWQWYLPDYMGMSVRLSEMLDHNINDTSSYWFALKTKESTLVRTEIESSISARALSQWLEFLGYPFADVIKERKWFSHNGMGWEVDKFQAPKPFFMAELELTEDLLEFDVIIPPQLEGAVEVTGQAEYYNRNM